MGKGVHRRRRVVDAGRQGTDGDVDDLAQAVGDVASGGTYDDEFLAACRMQHTLQPEQCDGVHTVVAARGDALLGFYRLAVQAPVAKLADLFVDPTVIGRGVGATLLADAVDRARALGVSRLVIDADPHAAGFYMRMGARRVGSVAAGQCSTSTTAATTNCSPPYGRDRTCPRADRPLARPGPGHRPPVADQRDRGRRPRAHVNAARSLVRRAQALPCAPGSSPLAVGDHAWRSASSPASRASILARRTSRRCSRVSASASIARSSSRAT
jgi:GNAT superfamily N-acetyltransferase